METLSVVLFVWAEASLGMKILAVLATIAFFILLFMVGFKAINKTTGRMEWVDGLFSDLGCLPKLIIIIVCIAIILLFLQLDGNYVFWRP